MHDYFDAMTIPLFEPESERLPRFLILTLAFIGFGVVFVRTAWLADDAFITLRTVDNFVSGHGLRWNVSERVQTYTHPLWMMVLAAAFTITHEPYFTTIFISVLFSLLSLVVFAWVSPLPRKGVVLGLLALLFSKAYIDFGVSGLENPLYYALLFGLYAVCMSTPKERTPLLLALIMSALLMTRSDLLLVALPVASWMIWRMRHTRQLWWQLLAGFMPLLVWHTFATFYYGFPIPNTAFAKLNTGIHRMELMSQGVAYIANSLKFDPVTLCTAVFAIIVSIRRAGFDRAVALGIFGYLVYVVYIGGDYMSGRFLAPLVPGAVVILARVCDKAVMSMALTAAIVLVLLGFAAPYPTVTSGKDYGADRGNADFGNPERVQKLTIDTNGIADERAYEYLLSGLLHSKIDLATNRLTPPYTAHPKYQKIHTTRATMTSSGQSVISIGAVGLWGYFLGPNIHVADFYALGDPLLSKLPASDTNHWRIAHFSRTFPCGYLTTLSTGQNRIANAKLARYYESLSLVIKGPLSDMARLVEILKLNIGTYGPLLEKYVQDSRYESCN